MSGFERTDPGTWTAGPVARTVSDAKPRLRVALNGTIRDARTVTWGGGPAYRCTLDDGTGQIDLLFLGRHAVPGLGVGSRCRTEGTAMANRGHLVVWNPRYALDRTEPGALDTLPGTERLEGPSAHTEPESSSGPTAGTNDSGSEGVGDLVEAAGHFRIYLGAAAGVGKTIAMLDEAQRRRQRGADVVIGLVECHGRPVTEVRTQGLEVVPRMSVDYRGAVLEEMDLDAVLRRHPKVALVDELAHTNVPGSGSHEKRWQDVLELLEAGVDVITTVNIQHLESIADAVERITGVPVRERVPDWVVRRADQIELVDSSPEQLRRRMLHGNIYPPDKVSQALTHFFQADNLIALRELALRFLADETEEELLEHLARHESAVLWETAERIM
ncbi:MAG: hypothetical protein ACRDWN_07315, partial [Acidimicrobiales bacterium]